MIICIVTCIFTEKNANEDSAGDIYMSQHFQHVLIVRILIPESVVDANSALCLTLPRLLTPLTPARQRSEST